MPGPGILSGAVQQGIAQPEGANATPAPPETIAASQPAPEGGEVDPKSQDQYGQLMDNISKLIDGEKGREETHQKLMEMMARGKDNPGQALASAVVAVGDAVMRNAQESNVTISGDLLVAAAMDSIAALVDLASEAGFFQATEDDVANAYGLALMQFMQSHPEIVDWEGLMSSLEGVDQQAIDSAHTTYNSPGAQGGQGAPPAGGQPAPQGAPGGPQAGLMGAPR